ncbi:hypothetical protein KCU_11543 [Pasteurella multocida subsp. multocida str. P52VAC]|nr:hypothetical protein KCU_11543 [Pasteurella multocida subsp. multocida str. P52VAC]
MQIYNREHNVFIIRNVGHGFQKLGTFESKNFKSKGIRGIVSNEND